MDERREQSPRLRDLGEERRPVAGTSDFTSVGDVGDLPYAAEVEVEPPSRNIVPVVAAIVVVVVLIALGVLLLV